MKNKTTVNFYYKIKSLLSPEDFKKIKYKLYDVTNESLEAFYHIIVAGYSVNFALKNYRNLYEYIEDNPIRYSEALVTYAFYPGVEGGMHVSKTQWFELN